MMKCLVVEDEKVAAERLIGLIKKVDPNIEILDIKQSVKSTVAWLNANEQPELVFMDIQLADGLSFEVFEQHEADFPVIFTTAYNNYALQAFKHNSIDYLLKPIDPEELANAINKYKTRIQPLHSQRHVFEKMLQGFTQEYKRKFVIKVGEHIKVIKTHEVACFYSAEKAVFLQNNNGRDFALNYSLDQLEELVDPKQFYRISRKYLVAMDYIGDIISYSNSRLQLRLKNNTLNDMVVSRERVQSFKNWLES